MSRRKFSDDDLREALRAFARTHLVAGGSLRVKAYQAWVGAPVSFSALTKRLTSDNSWTTLLLENADDLAREAVDSDAVVEELPVACAGPGGVTWISAPVTAWSALRCECHYCEAPTLRQAFPELVPRLAHPRDAEKSSALWFEWACPVGHARHWPVRGPVTALAAGEIYCGGCRSLDRFYAAHPPGTIVDNKGVTRAKIEQPVLEELRKLMPGGGVSAELAIVTPREFEPLVGRAITPDLLFLEQRVAVEIDGGGAGSYSRHDSEEGAEDDITRDRALAALEFQSIRVRHPRSPVLAGSPAHVILTTSASPKVIAGLIFAGLHALTNPHTR